jgi:hypothetical protein
VGDADQVATALASVVATGWADGWLLRPDELPRTLAWLVDEVVPRLQAAGALRSLYDEATVRERFGLEWPVNRYAVG